MAANIDSINLSIELAANYHRQGRIQDAERIYRSILQQQPANIDANYLLGLVELERGKFATAATLIQQALNRMPGNALYHYNYGRAVEGEGKIQEAEASYRRALNLDKEYLEARYQLAVLMHNAQRLEEAVKEYRTLIEQQPNLASVFNNLGNALLDLGRRDEAAAMLERAVALEPRFAQGWCNFGNVLHQLGRAEESEQAYRKAIEFDPSIPNFYYNYANLQFHYCQYEPAIANYREAIRRDPNFAGAYNNLGNLLKLLGRLNEALEAFNQAIKVAPSTADAYSNKGNALVGMGEIDEAIRSYRTAVELNPRHVDAYSNLVYALCYPANLPEQQIFAEHREWSRRFEEPILAPRPAARPLAGRRLRVGYLSGDFRRHSVGFFFEPLLNAHHRDRVELFLYSNAQLEDDVTERMRTRAEHWRTITDISDDAAAKRMREDELDILVDLSGHTDRNRLLILPRRPAPTQVNWLGYPNTTGLTSVDYRFTDEVADPPGAADELHSEKLWRLPNGFLCYEGYENAPQPAPPPCLEKGHITFGSFNNLTKVNPEVVRAWARILAAIPGSRLMIKTNQLEDYDTRIKMAAQFDAEGIAPDRLRLLARTPGLREHLEVYSQMDIALDTFPYNGTTTTCEALWMGVPVLTLSSDCHRGRVSKSILHRVGLDDLSVSGPDELVAKAVALSQDIDRLKHLRNSLRGQMRESPLCDAEGFATQMEDAFHSMLEGALEG